MNGTFFQKYSHLYPIIIPESFPMVEVRLLCFGKFFFDMVYSCRFVLFNVLKSSP